MDGSGSRSPPGSAATSSPTLGGGVGVQLKNWGQPAAAVTSALHSQSGQRAVRPSPRPGWASGAGAPDTAVAGCPSRPCALVAALHVRRLHSLRLLAGEGVRPEEPDHPEAVQRRQVRTPPGSRALSRAAAGWRAWEGVRGPAVTGFFTQGPARCRGHLGPGPGRVFLPPEHDALPQFPASALSGFGEKSVTTWVPAGSWSSIAACQRC